uniref:Uncharacterized protein n=1 Tax=Hyaloperonospora arabidopsidis (strain Emoy2) TaxID=559515 RepID=M4C1N3_HYAAE
MIEQEDRRLVKEIDDHSSRSTIGQRDRRSVKEIDDQSSEVDIICKGTINGRILKTITNCDCTQQRT